MQSLSVGSFPYSPGLNPYQRLITDAMESSGLTVKRIPPRRSFPISYALSHDVDLLHLDWHHSWYRGSGSLQSLIKRSIYRYEVSKLQRLPTIWTAHNLFPHKNKNAPVDHDMTQRLIDQCRGIMAMSESAAKLVGQEYDIGPQTELRVIYHGHYCDCYENAITQSEARRQLDIPESDFVYLSLGTLLPYKGHAELIDAFHRCSGKNDRLLIVGGNADNDYVKRLIASSTASSASGSAKVQIVAESVSDDQLQVYFNAANVVVLPFSNILNSGSLLLAMSFGKPIVAPRIGSIPEIAHSSSFAGYDQDEPDGLENALMLAKKIDISPQTIIEFTRQKYCWEKIGLELSSWYHRLAQKN